MKDNRCYSCRIVHPHVDFGGIHNCPNPLCTISGTASFRAKFRSYKSTRDGYTVDPEEAVVEGIRQTIETRDPVILDAAIKKLTEYWVPLLKLEFAKEGECK